MFTPERLEQIFDRTNGKCHICGRKLCFGNYAAKLDRNGRYPRGAWEVEHSIPQCNGGTHHANNLYAAHIVCNRRKGNCTTRSARLRNGMSRAPKSKERIASEKHGNGVVGAASLALLGARIAGPLGFIVGGLAGYAFGESLDVES